MLVPAIASWLDKSLQSVAQMRLAVTARLGEAVACLAAGEPGAAVYLAGYVYEMILKTASFSLGGASYADPVRPLLTAVSNRANPRAPARLGLGGRLVRPFALRCRYRLPADAKLPSPYAAKYEGHSLRFWCEYYLGERQAAGRLALPSSVVVQLTDYVDWAADRWSVDMRYVDLQAVSRREATRFVWRARWLWKQWSALER